MTVQRRAIRCRVRELLLGKTAAGQNVTAQRADPVRPQIEGHVALAVYTLRETVFKHADTPRAYRRELEVAVEVFVEETKLDVESLEDLIDDTCDQVECALEPELPQLAQLEVPGEGRLDVNPSLSGLERVEVDIDGTGRQLAGAARLVFLVVYGTDVDERAQARAADLLGGRVTYRFPPVEDGPEPPSPAAEDEITLAGG